jgi:hypothetical protein
MSLKGLSEGNLMAIFRTGGGGGTRVAAFEMRFQYLGFVVELS